MLRNDQLMKAVVFAAGLGKRLRPLTTTRPKHLLPIAGKTIIKRVLESLRVEDIDEVGIVTSYMSEVIINEVSRYNLGIKIEWIFQEEPRGTGHALYVCREFLKDEDHYLVSYGDITLNDRIVKDLLSFFKENSCDGVIEGVYVEDTSRYGRIIFRENELEKIEEKSMSGPGIINSGLYILPREAVEIAGEIKLSQRAEYELTDVLNILVSRNYKILVHLCDLEYQHPSSQTGGWWIDIGYPSDYLRANIRKFMEEFGNKIISYSTVDSSIHLKQPSMIFNGVRIGGDSVIGPNAFIMESVEIGSRSRIENSILLERCIIGRNSTIRNAIIGEDATIGEDVKIEGREEDVIIIAPRTSISSRKNIKRQ